MLTMWVVTELTSYRPGNVNYGLWQGKSTFIGCCISFILIKAEHISDHQILTAQMLTWASVRDIYGIVIILLDLESSCCLGLLNLISEAFYWLIHGTRFSKYQHKLGDNKSGLNKLTNKAERLAAQTRYYLQLLSRDTLENIEYSCEGSLVI